MARTVGPLMSLEASGSVAKTLTYSRWKGRPYVRQLVTPANPRSPLQVSTRAIMRFLSQQWTPGVTALKQATWDALAKMDSISPFNAFVRENLRQWTQFLPPSEATPITRAATLQTFTSLPAATGGVRQVTIDWTTLLINAGWGLLIFGPGVGAVTPARDNLAYCALSGAGAQSAVLTPVAAGTWHYNFMSFTNDGKLSTALGDVTATVT